MHVFVHTQVFNSSSGVPGCSSHARSYKASLLSVSCRKSPHDHAPRCYLCLLDVATIKASLASASCAQFLRAVYACKRCSLLTETAIAPCKYVQDVDNIKL